MTKEDLLRKLTSRKLWITIIGDIIGICTLLNASSDAQIQMVTSIILIIASTVAYVIGESKIDASSTAQHVITAAQEVLDVVNKYNESTKESPKVETTETPVIETTEKTE